VTFFPRSLNVGLLFGVRVLSSVLEFGFHVNLRQTYQYYILEF